MRDAGRKPIRTPTLACLGNEIRPLLRPILYHCLLVVGHTRLTGSLLTSAIEPQVMCVCVCVCAGVGVWPDRVIFHKSDPCGEGLGRSLIRKMARCLTTKPERLCIWGKVKHGSADNGVWS